MSNGVVQVSNLYNNGYSSGTPALTFPNPPTVGNLMVGIAYAYETPGGNSSAGWETAAESYQSSVVVYKYVTEEDSLSNTIYPFSFNVYGQSGIVYEISGPNSTSPILNMRINDSGQYNNGGSGNPYTDPGLAVTGPCVALSFMTQYNYATSATTNFTQDAFNGQVFYSFGGHSAVVASHTYYLAGQSAANQVTFAGSNNDPAGTAPSAIQASILVLVESYDVPGAPPQNPNVIVPESSIIVTDGTNFKRGQAVAIYNGGNTFDTGLITNIIGNQLYLDSTLLFSHIAGSSVLTLRNRGTICSVDQDANLQNLQQVTTQGYFQQLNNPCVVVEFKSTSVSGGYECGWVALHLLNLYSGQLNLGVNADNIVYSYDGNPAHGGTGQSFSGQYVNTQLISVMQDILSQANGGLSFANNGSGAASGDRVASQGYRAWCDEHAQFQFTAVNTTTPTVTGYLSSYGEASQNGSFDCVISHQPHVQDTTGLYNAYFGVGANVGLNNVAAISSRLIDSESVAIYGQREQYISAPQINDVQAMNNYLQTLLDQNAWPLTQYTTEFYPSRTFITCNDYVAIVVDDTRTDVMTPQTVQTSWNASEYNQIHQKITGGVILPDIGRIVNQVSAQHYTALVGGITQGGVALNRRYLLNTVEANYNYGDTSVTLSGGVLKAQVS